MTTIFVVRIGPALLRSFDDIDEAKRWAEQATDSTQHQSWQRLAGERLGGAIRPEYNPRPSDAPAHLRLLELHHGGMAKASCRRVLHVPF